MGLFKITLTDDAVITSYMGGKPDISPICNAWYGILQCLRLGGDVIEVSDKRDPNKPLYSDLTFSFNTTTAARRTPKDDELIDPLRDPEALHDWLKKNPDELERISRLINNK